MKKIKVLIGMLTVTIFSFCNVCFADVIGPTPWDTSDYSASYGGGHGVEHRLYSIENIVIIGILILTVAVCATLIIRRIIKKKKENDNK